MDSQTLDILRADNPWLNGSATPASVTPMVSLLADPGELDRALTPGALP